MGLRVAIAGASGYAGGELLRLVAGHPGLEVVAVTAHGNAGQRVEEVHPNLRSLAGMVFARHRRTRWPARILSSWRCRTARRRRSPATCPRRRRSSILAPTTGWS